MKVITHSGHFQADDVFAIAALSLLLGDFELTRTRDPEIIKIGDYVVDVGGIYDPETRRFDHHQEGGAGKRENGVPYSSIGLVWKHYGPQIAGSHEAAEHIDEKLVQPLDATDNGVSIYTSEGIYPYVIDDIVFSFIPTWKEGEIFDERFKEAVDVAKKILSHEITKTQDAAEARVIVEAIYQNTADKRIIVMEKSYPTGDVLDQHPGVLFTVKPEVESRNPAWKVYAVRENPHGFKNRKPLPLTWAGKSGIELQAITGVPDATFCHNKRFVAGAKSREGAIALAKLALESS